MTETIAEHERHIALARAAVIDVYEGLLVPDMTDAERDIAWKRAARWVWEHNIAH